MRLLEDSHNPDVAKGLSELLTDRGIDHKFEAQTNNDWGDEHYGEADYRIWIIDEDEYADAQELERLYKEDPLGEAVKLKKKSKAHPFSHKSSHSEAVKLIPDPPMIPQGNSPATKFIILLCTLVFFMQSLGVSYREVESPSRLYIPSIVDQWFFYDFPEAAFLYTKGVENLPIHGEDNSPTAALSEGHILMKKALTMPIWEGYYERIIAWAHGNELNDDHTPWFEKIQQGEFWRLFTPALLHANLLHILFNLLWFWMLGKEIEKTVGMNRFYILILITALVSNTAQYLMSGFDFLGLSGVVAGLLFFIGERQRKAPWEGYTLQKSVYYFLLIYIFGLAAVQSLSFLLAIANFQPLPIAIANTAHVAGALTGFMLGRLNLFAWKG